MKRLRFILFFVFYAAAEMTVPQAVNALEAAEEAEESAHPARRMRQSYRAALWQTPASAQAVMVRVAPRASTAPAVTHTRMTPASEARKIPPAFADSPSAPEDH